MKAITLTIGSFLFIAALCEPAALAQVQRTFVSGLGSDANPCTRTAPCRTFPQAISQTSTGGEVYVLDSAGFGAFTINKAISIVAPSGVTAGISVFSGDGIVVNAGASDTVALRGLTVNNQGSTGNGVVFNTGGMLHLESCVISGFTNSLSAGLKFLGSGNLDVKDSIARGNYDGILVQPSSGTAFATVDHVRLESNTNAGLQARDGSQVAVSNSLAANNGDSGFRALSNNSGSVQMTVQSSVSSNSGAGIIAIAALGTVQVDVDSCLLSGSKRSQNSGGIVLVGGAATARVSNSTVTGNSVGLLNIGPDSFFFSRGNNTVEGNGSDTLGRIGFYSAK